MIAGLTACFALLLASCAGEDEPSAQAFCDQLEQSEARLQDVADDASVAGSDLARLLIGLGAVGEYEQMLDELVAVAPAEVEGDMRRARDAFAAQREGFLGDGSPGGVAVSALNGLFIALANQTAFDNVDAFATANCGRTVFAFTPTAAGAGPTDGEDPDGQAAPTGAFLGEDLEGVAWYASQLPAEPLADDELPFVQCHDGAADALWALDLEEPATRPVLELSGACNMRGSLTNTQFTHDGRYLVTIWDSEAFGADSRVLITDVETGERHEQRTSDMSARITALTSEGLDATSTTVSLVGFDASGGGSVHYSEGRSTTLGSPDDYWVASIDEVLDPAQPPPASVDWGICYESYRSNPSGTHCTRGPPGSSTNALLPATGQDFNDDLASTASWASLTYWLDDEAVVGTTGPGKAIWSYDLGEGAAEAIVEIGGERTLSLWPRSSTGQVFFTSLTLDEQHVEVYEASLQGDEPVLRATLPSAYELVPLPS